MRAFIGMLLVEDREVLLWKCRPKKWLSDLESEIKYSKSEINVHSLENIKFSVLPYNFVHNVLALVEVHTAPVASDVTIIHYCLGIIH